jgi:hypothetical protein
VAVSAYELESMPLPELDTLDIFVRLFKERASREQLEGTCTSLYGERI